MLYPSICVGSLIMKIIIFDARFHFNGPFLYIDISTMYFLLWIFVVCKFFGLRMLNY
jgi:hypothetical protein